MKILEKLKLNINSTKDHSVEEILKESSEKVFHNKTKLLRSESFQSSDIDKENFDLNYYIDILKWEKNRLKTFKKWNISFMQPLDLAQAGFFYLSKDDKVQCVYCQLKLWNWSKSDIPILIHFKLSPKCNFLNGYNVNNVSETNFNPVTALKFLIDDKYEFKGLSDDSIKELNFINKENKKKIINSFILKFEHCKDKENLLKNSLETYKQKKMNSESFNKLCLLMKNYENRLLSFTLNKWPHDFIKPEKLVESGFFYTGKNDNVMCSFCTICICGWISTDNPLIEHFFKSKNCSFLKDKKIFFDLKNRIFSFQNWQLKFQNPESLAKSGFYYTGDGDCVKCFSCKLILNDWKPNDDPFLEHKKYSSECVYINS